MFNLAGCCWDEIHAIMETPLLTYAIAEGYATQEESDDFWKEVMNNPNEFYMGEIYFTFACFILLDKGVKF